MQGKARKYTPYKGFASSRAFKLRYLCILGFGAMQRGIFLDRDGVINQERATYTYRTKDFVLLPGVYGAIQQLHVAGFLLVVITNQGGISRGLYSREDVEHCHTYMQKCLKGLLKGILYSPYHPEQTLSLSRKPSPYLFERAMALYGIGAPGSWAVGDQVRDIVAARAAGLSSIGVGAQAQQLGADFYATDLPEATQHIILSKKKR